MTHFVTLEFCISFSEKILSLDYSNLLHLMATDIFPSRLLTFDKDNLSMCRPYFPQYPTNGTASEHQVLWIPSLAGEYQESHIMAFAVSRRKYTIHMQV
jgi:hypothetical protein